jgi:Sortase domain
VAAALLSGGVLAVGAGAVSIALLTGQPGITPRPVAHPGPVPTGPVVSPPKPVARVYVPRPVYLSIPAIGVRTPLTKLGLTPQGTLQVPSSTSVAGWYTGSPRPGQVGSAIIVGHIDTALGPGVFFRLRLLRPGDRIYVRRAGGKLAVFKVYAEHMYAKSSFPTQRVYGPAPDPELRLITCGGVFDPATGSYLSNVVVYASQVR